jgi:hypothetical protein
MSKKQRSLTEDQFHVMLLKRAVTHDDAMEEMSADAQIDYMVAAAAAAEVVYAVWVEGSRKDEYDTLCFKLIKGYDRVGEQAVEDEGIIALTVPHAEAAEALATLVRASQH